jgi:hypothetical protein
MVRSARFARVSNHEAVRIPRDARKSALLGMRLFFRQRQRLTESNLDSSPFLPVSAELRRRLDDRRQAK